MDPDSDPDPQHCSALIFLQYTTYIGVQGGSDKSGIFLFYLLNGTTQLKIIRFYCSEKKKLQIYILRINLSNKTAVSSEDSLDRGPEAPDES